MKNSAWRHDIRRGFPKGAPENHFDPLDRSPEYNTSKLWSARNADAPPARGSSDRGDVKRRSNPVVLSPV